MASVKIQILRSLQLQRGLAENWWDLRLNAMTDEITLKFGGLILLLTAWEILMHRLA